MSAARTLRIIAIVGAILLLLWLLADVLLLVFLAILIAAILRALARWTSRKTHLPQHAALACVTLVLITMLGVLVHYLGPLLIVQGEAMWQSVLHQIDAMRSADGRTDWDQWILQRLSAWTAVGGPLATSASSFITAGRALVLWPAGQFVDMLVVGVMVAIGFSALHLPLAFGLAVLAGLLTFVPVLVAIFAAIPALIVGLAAGWHTAVWVTAVFLCCHIVEAYIVVLRCNGARCGCRPPSPFCR